MHPADSSASVDRREFFRRSLRYAGLTGVAAVAASAVARRAPWTGPGCGGDGICGGCSLLPGCREQRAAATRAHPPAKGTSP